MEVSGQLHSLATLLLRKEPLVPIGYEARWALEPVWVLWSREKCLAPARNRTPAVQAVACHYPGLSQLKQIISVPLLPPFSASPEL
jgi:hypothetical protein